MNDDQKWLEAAAALEQDILYLKAASRAGELPHRLDQEIGYLKVAVSVYRKNAAAGVAWPSPDDLYCINIPSCMSLPVATDTRRDFKIAS